MKILRYLFLPLSWLYGFIIILRNYFYDIGIFRIDNVAVPVISVGNITAGGTGKTPMIEFIVRYYMRQNKKVAVLSRGYKRTTRGFRVVSDGVNMQGTPETCGDEPYQIAKKFPGAIVLVDENRVRAAKIAKERYNPDVLLLDDGFQHRGIDRQLDFVLIDGAEMPAEIPLLPAGIRREPISALQRADLVILTRTSAVDETLKRKFIKYTQAPVASIDFKPKRFFELLTGKEVESSEILNASYVAFCGIGNPISFKKILNELGIAILDFKIFPDHHRYNQSDLDNIKIMYEETKAQRIMTTEKDAVRLSSLKTSVVFQSNAFVYIEIHTVVTSGEDILTKLLNDAVSKTGR
ncbi:MAG: tetraacyldisaccharide 4'-kinase [Bacteroidota bacterium]|nr:tetraacyldisaccharide 4'-kinase [Bacteroidota bacterium]